MSDASDDVIAKRLKLKLAELRALTAHRRRITTLDPAADGIDYAVTQLENAIANVAIEVRSLDRRTVFVPEIESALLAGRVVLLAANIPTEMIYALVDPLTPEVVRYVGRTSDAAARYRMHITQGSYAVREWVRELESSGRAPAMVLLERCGLSVVASREDAWLRHFRQKNEADLNFTMPVESRV